MNPPVHSTVEYVLAMTGFVLLLAMTIPSTWFAWSYFRRSNWRATLTGKGLLLQASVLAVTLDFSALFGLLSITGGVYAYTLQVALFGLLNWALWFQVVVLRRAQAADRASRAQALEDARLDADDDHAPGRNHP